MALDYFTFRVARELAALASALGGLDGVLFTAGIGENSPEIRARVCARAAWLGLHLDTAANRAGGPRISAAKSRVSAWVIPTDEGRMLAEHTVEPWRRGRRTRAAARGAASQQRRKPPHLVTPE